MNHRTRVLAAVLGGLLSLAAAPAAWADRDHGHGRGHDRDWDDDDRGGWRRDDHHEHHDNGWHNGHRKRVIIERERIVVFRERPPAPVYRSFYDTPAVITGGRCNRGLLDANFGTLLGAAAGGFAGSQFGHGDGKLAATGAGVLLGAVLGNQLGAADRGCVMQSLERVPSGQAVMWDNPDGGRYTFTPTQTFEDEDGRYCREYTTRIKVGGRTQSGYGTACRQPDGQWQIVE